MSTQTKPIRDFALDFTKGTLVLLMVVYHWLNYFVTVEGFAYNYIRFITPSFVFLAGFLVTNLLVDRPGKMTRSVGPRLIIRGFKLLILFTILNLFIASLAFRDAYGRSRSILDFVEAIPATYVSGIGIVATFWVLVPISYTLIIGGLLLKIRDLTQIHLLTLACFVFSAIIGTILLGIRSPTIELIGSGILGFVVGYVLNKRLKLLIQLWPWLIVFYLLHIAAITFLGVPFGIQLVAVCLNFWLLYFVACGLRLKGQAMRLTSLLGQYTLLSYIGQIAILQLLVIAFRLVDFGSAESFIALAVTLLLTVALVAITDLLRRKLPQVNSIYRLVFA